MNDWKTEFDERFAPPDWLANELTEEHMVVASRKEIKKFIEEAVTQAKLEGRKEFLAELGDIYFGTDWIEEPKSAKWRIGALIDLSAARNN